MTNILTASEAATVLRCDSTDADMLALLPQVDAYIKKATGRDWSADTTVEATAKSAARILITMWHENPGMMSGDAPSLGAGLQACLVQLEAMALFYKEFWGRDGAGPCELPGAYRGDSVAALIGLVGVSGDQSANFESVITIDREIQQTSTSDLESYIYRAKLVSPADLPGSTPAAPADLVLSSSDPVDSEIGVAITADILLTFNNQLLDEAKDNIMLLDDTNAQVSASVTLDQTGKIVTIDPATSLINSTAYTVIMAGVEDIYGDTFNDVIIFTTAAAT